MTGEKVSGSENKYSTGRLPAWLRSACRKIRLALLNDLIDSHRTTSQRIHGLAGVSRYYSSGSRYVNLFRRLHPTKAAVQEQIINDLQTAGEQERRSNEPGGQKQPAKPG